MDIAALALGVMDEMGGNLSQLGSDVLEKRQKEDQRAWDLGMWNLQNTYNDPSAQMQRLREAGLNPNLMYGKGTTGNSTSQVPSSRSNASGKLEFDALGKYTAALHNELVPYQLDLTKQQFRNSLIESEILEQNLKQEKADTYVKEHAQNGRSIYEEYRGQREWNKWFVENQTTENRIEVIKTQDNILKLQSQLLSGQISQQNYEIELNKLGLTKNDPTVYRVFKDFMEYIMTK